MNPLIIQAMGYKWIKMNQLKYLFTTFISLFLSISLSHFDLSNLENITFFKGVTDPSILLL